MYGSYVGMEIEIMFDSLYREELLEHYRSPLNFGKIRDSDIYSRQTNPLCGDDISIWIKFDYDGESVGVIERHPEGVIEGVIVEIGFEGKGCAICLAGASMLTEYAKGRSKKELTKFSEQDMLGLLGIEVSETRKKCAILALYVLKDCLYAVQSKS